MDDEKFKEVFGENLKRIRIEKGLSQELLAGKIGIEIHNLSRIETGRSFPRVKTLVKIFNALETTPTRLFYFEENSCKNDSKVAINGLMDKNPEKIDDFYKILLAIV